MTIRIMTFEGCPNCGATRKLVEETVRELDMRADIEEVQVQDENEAQRRGVPGLSYHPDRWQGHRNEQAEGEGELFLPRLSDFQRHYRGAAEESVLDAIREAQAHFS